MQDSESQQHTIFGEALDEQVRVETTGRVIRPFRRMIDQVAGEYKLVCDNTGLYTSVMDTANVQMIEIQLHGNALESIDIDDECILGVNSEDFGGALRYARYGKSTDDDITIWSDGEYLETETSREVGNNPATINERMALIDPTSIREMPEIQELDFGTKVELDPKTFVETVGLLDTDSMDHVKLGANADSIVFSQEKDITKRNIRIESDPSDVTEWSIYSANYIERLQNIVRDGYVDNLTLKWNDEFPLRVEFEREGVYSGHVLTAPRIKS